VHKLVDEVVLLESVIRKTEKNISNKNSVTADFQEKRRGCDVYCIL